MKTRVHGEYFVLKDGMDAKETIQSLPEAVNFVVRRVLESINHNQIIGEIDRNSIEIIYKPDVDHIGPTVSIKFRTHEAEDSDADAGVGAGFPW